MKLPNRIFSHALPTILASLAGFIGGWCANTLPIASAQTKKSPGVIDVTGIRLIDSSGKVRGIFAALPNPTFSLMRRNGKGAVSMALDDNDSPLIGFGRSNGEPSLLIGLDDKENTLMSFMRAGSKIPTLKLGLTSGGKGLVGMTNSNGKPAAVLTVEADESGELHLLDAFGNHKRN